MTWCRRRFSGLDYAGVKNEDLCLGRRDGFLTCRLFGLQTHIAVFFLILDGLLVHAQELFAQLIDVKRLGFLQGIVAEAFHLLGI